MCKILHISSIEEKVSGVKDRPELDKALAYLREGDTFVIWKLDRLGRSLKDLVYIVDCLQKRKIAFKSIVDGIDTNSALGRCQFGIFASLAEYEREIIVERTRAGLQAAKERGKLTGRPIGLSEDAKRKAIAAKRLYENRDYSITVCIRLLLKHLAANLNSVPSLKHERSLLSPFYLNPSFINSTIRETILN